MNRNWMLFILVFAQVLPSLAQEDSRRYRFAQTYFGLELEYAALQHDFQIPNVSGELEPAGATRLMTPRFTIGGTHFWGHADFYISIPLVNLRLQRANHAVFSITDNVVTSFRAYPWKLKPNAIRPYAGVALTSPVYQQRFDHLENGNGPRVLQTQGIGELGLGYIFKKRYLLDLAVRIPSKVNLSYPLPDGTFADRELPNMTFGIAVKKLFDYTASYISPESKVYIERLQSAYDEQGANSAWSIAIGPSSLISLESSEHFEQYPSLAELDGKLYPDIGIGYHFYRWDASARLAFRPLRSKATAYGESYTWRRNSLSLEGLKFLGDYHGFVPFVGPYLSADRYVIQDSQEPDMYKTNALGYGLVFGWDIRPSRTDWILLRTNLRYNPRHQIFWKDRNITFRQLEFNFIQLVVYPKRRKVEKQM